MQPHPPTPPSTSSSFINSFIHYTIIIIAGFYVTAPQGRPGGVNDLSLADGKELLQSRKLNKQT
jgi:hypothetical protein